MDKLRDPAALIALFNHNVALEHGAIVQYLSHAYAIGEAGVGAEIINIARSEMRHLKYFAEMIVEWGGLVTLDRPVLSFDAPSVLAMLRLEVAAEEDAIQDYGSQLEYVDHPGAQRLLARVLEDERLHREQFLGFEAEVAAQAEQVAARYPHGEAPVDPELAVLVSDSFCHEYNQILVYLRHYFQLRDWHAKDIVFENAFWRMKTMSQLADELHEQGVDADFTASPHPVEGPAAARLQQLRTMEQADETRYRRLAGCPIPPGMRAIFQNTALHNSYQDEQLQILSDLLSPPWTVGSLLDSPPARQGGIGGVIPRWTPNASWRVTCATTPPPPSIASGRPCATSNSA